MNTTMNSHRMMRIRVIIFLSLFGPGTLYSQSNPYVRVNRIWGGVSSNGGNTGISYGASNLNLFADYNAYGARFQGGESYFGANILIGTNNWNGQPAVFSPLSTDQPQGNILTPLVNYARYANPNYTVISQNITGTPSQNDLGTVVIDPNKCIGTSDQSVIITNGYITPNLKILKKVLAWSQQFHDNYAIVDLTITNTGSSTLTGVYIAMSDGEYQLQGADGNNPTIAAVDRYTTTSRKWYHYYGANTSDTLRVYYYWASDDPEAAGDRIGQPLTQQGGRLLDYTFTFMACLHASKQPYTPTPSYSTPIDPNDQDDMNQPMVTTVADKQVLNLPLVNQTYNPTGSTGAAEYNYISGAMLQSEDIISPTVRPGHHRKNLDELGVSAPGGQNGISALSNSFEGPTMSFGPYTFAPGQQIRIVKAVGIAGLSRDKAIEVGREWLNDTRYGTTTLDDPNPSSPTGSFPANFVFPQNATPTDIKKDKWVSTGIDSVKLTVSRAKYNFLSNYNAPSTPPPPSFVSVAGSSAGIVLRWSDAAAEARTNFAGYRIMKKIGPTDTTYYQEVYRSTATDTAHSYVDRNVRVGGTHYYYIQSMATISSTDLNAHPSERGKTIYSGRVYFYNNLAVTGEAPVGSVLEKIAMVPNPFNWNDPLLRGYGYTNPSNLQISFYELPRMVTIQIYTEVGDLVKTIYHNQSSGFNKWNMTNEAGQTVASGIYVVLFTTPDGGTSYQKLVIVR